MSISETLRKQSESISLGFFPPRAAAGRAAFLAVVRDLGQYDPLYVSVTYGAGGTTRDRTAKAPGWIKQGTGLTVMSRPTCVGAKKAEGPGYVRTR
jgi:methylenetetrahydrofolate reductase (NADPH)